MTHKDKAALVLLSGGMDSSTLLHHVIKNLGCSPVKALSFCYGQKHSRELECAKWQAQTVAVSEHRVIDISFMGDLLKAGSALIDGGESIPALEQLNADELIQPPTYVPNRNMMLLSIAIAYAEAQKISDVFYGAQAQDEYGYWDCTTEFIDRINNVLALNRKTHVKVHAPFVEKSKADTLKIGLVLGVDYSHTWSCYKGEENPCLICPTCVERSNAFNALNIPDPLHIE